MADSSNSKEYLFHINGLRALAILGVFLYHLNAEYCPAGYFGVDLFLVISGFLLFRSLLKPEAASGFRYGSYLVRKGWRILPSWACITVLTCLLALAFMSADRASTSLSTANFSAIFISDWQIDLSGDYFHPLSRQNPLLHLWYLSITEQLYLLAPLLVIPLSKYCSRKAAAGLLVCLGVLSLSYYLLTTTEMVSAELRASLLQGLNFKSAYYHLVPRLWEVLAGAGVLLLPNWSGRSRLRAVLAVAGLAGLLCSFWMYDTGSSAVYLTVISSLLLLRYGDSGVVNWLLCWKPVQFLGAISFSLYLWHWPVMTFWKYVRFDKPAGMDEVGMSLLSLLLGYLAWRWVERWKIAPKTKVRAVLATVGIVCLPLGIFWGSEAATKTIAKLKLPAEITNKIPSRCDGATALGGFPSELFLRTPIVIGSEDDSIIPSFFLMGDSHAQHLYNGLDEACRLHGIRGIFLNNPVAPYWYLQQPMGSTDKIQWGEPLAEALLAYLAKHPEIQVVLIAQRWDSRMRSFAGGIARDWRTGKIVHDGEERRLFTTEGLRETCRRLKESGKQVVILGDVPSFKKPDPLDEWERYQKLRVFGISVPERKISVEQHEKSQKFSHSILPDLACQGIADAYFDLATPLMEDGFCHARKDGKFLYRDHSHLTALGSTIVSKYLIEQLMQRFPNLRGGDQGEPHGEDPSPQDAPESKS